MKAKKYLQQLRGLDIMINQKIKELNDLKIRLDNISSIDYSKERVQTGSSKNAPFIELIERIVDTEEGINREIDIFINEKQKIINQIYKLHDINYIELLYKRYVEFKKFETIAVEMNFTYQYIRELHRRALEEFERTYINLHKPTFKCDII